MLSMELREIKKAVGLAGLTVEQYEQMRVAGILHSGDPIELLDGVLVRKDRAKAGGDPMMVGDDHIWAVQRLNRLMREVERYGCHFRIQQPLRLDPDSAPEPDGAIAIGDEDRYRAQPFTPADAPCVIEVADSSLQRDRVTKLRIYADGGVGQYVIVNLVENVVEVYEGPVAGEGRYRQSRRLAGADVVRFACGGGNAVEVEARRLLPPAA